MTEQTYSTDHEREAYALGVTHALAAASWIIDGNTDAEHYRRVLAMIDDGDPAAEQYLPACPDLSGEWADDPTPASLYEEIVGESYDETLVGTVLDAIANAYEEGVSETFESECERLLRATVEPDDWTDPESPHVGHFSRLSGTWWCDTCNSPYCDLA